MVLANSSIGYSRSPGTFFSFMYLCSTRFKFSSVSFCFRGVLARSVSGSSQNLSIFCRYHFNFVIIINFTYNTWRVNPQAVSVYEMYFEWMHTSIQYSLSLVVSPSLSCHWYQLFYVLDDQNITAFCPICVYGYHGIYEELSSTYQKGQHAYL